MNYSMMIWANTYQINELIRTAILSFTTLVQLVEPGRNRTSRPLGTDFTGRR